MTRDFHLKYSQQMVRSAVNRFWRRSIGWKFVAALLLLSGALVFHLVNDDRSWYVGMMGTVLLLGVLIIIAGYVAQYRRAVGTFRRLSDGSALLRVTADGFRLESAIGYSDLSWGAITEIWRYADFWLLVFSRNMFSTLPILTIDAESQAEIIASVRAAGGRID